MWSVVFACLGALALEEKPAGAPPSCLKLEYAIALSGVEGRIDHMAFDSKRGLVWVSARDNDSIEVLDGRAGSWKASIRPRFKPQGALFVETLDRAVISCGEGEFLELFEWSEDPEVRRYSSAVTIGPDGDNIRWLHGSGAVLVGVGERLTIVDPGMRNPSFLGMKVTGKIELGAHPESFQFGLREKRCWVNVPEKQSIAVIDLETKKVERWIDVKAAKKNYPMALAEKDKRLIIGCREPAKMLVFDIETDAMTAELPLSGDVDDIFVDEARGVVYASCGEGFVDVFERTAPGTWKPKEKVATSAGARTCLFVAAEKKLYVAVPHRGEQKAEVRVFSTAP